MHTTVNISIEKAARCTCTSGYTSVAFGIQNAMRVIRILNTFEHVLDACTGVALNVSLVCTTFCWFAPYLKAIHDIDILYVTCSHVHMCT